MNTVAIAIVSLFSVILPSREWYHPGKPLEVALQSEQAVRLVLVDFAGKQVEPTGDNLIQPGGKADLRALYPRELDRVGAYVALAVPDGKPTGAFVGTPVVVEVLGGPRPEPASTVNVIRVAPLVYAKMTTSKGELKMLFWYDVAPVTVNSFISLAAGRFYDGIIFHRIIPDFVIQAGDPLGTGVGGPGYGVPGEFNDRPHDVGVLSMARKGDALEQQGMQPRTEFANSGGSQFFICLSREKTRALDRRYTAFGQVFAGLETVKAIGAEKTAAGDRPVEPPVIQSVEIVPVKAGDNPYAEMLKLQPVK
jgi:cyclophilin family peptidyl-prolyl cis-trans isomerase